MGKKKKILFLKKFGKLSEKLEKKFSSFLQATEQLWKTEETETSTSEEQKLDSERDTKPVQKKKTTKPKATTAKKRTTTTTRKRRTTKTKTEA